MGTVELDIITVTATRAEKDPFQTPNAITVLNAKSDYTNKRRARIQHPT